MDQAVTAHSMLDRAVVQGEISQSARLIYVQAEGAIGMRLVMLAVLVGSRDRGRDVALLDAVTLAHYAAKTIERDPGRRQALPVRG